MSKVTELINKIIWKDNWETKFCDSVILEKWREESKKFATDDDFDMAVRILSAMLNRRMKDENGNYVSDREIKIKGLDDYDSGNDSCDSDDLDFDKMKNNKKEIKKKDKKNVKYYPSLYHEPKKELLDFLQSFNDDKFKNIAKEFKNQINEIEKKSNFYHPGSKNKVLDIVHPSLYCYVKGFSLKNGSVEKPNKSDDINEKYQWLPSEFQIYPNKKVKIISYINNLDRKEHSDLYISIEQIFEQFLPHFENLLGLNLEGNCQVITKIANIIVSPQDKVYEGGVWHLEGMNYENIIATGIYYYEVDNIKNSYLEFRKLLQEPIYYPQDGHDYVKKKYGLYDGDQLNKYLGKISTSESGRCIVFPNYIQHKVSDFELVNKNKTGIRKILVFFLIDPKKRITSTADVPIQQRHLVKKNMMEKNDHNIPEELIDSILDNMHLMTEEDAQNHMKNLMLSRKYYTDKINEELFEREFSLCEH